VYKCLKDKDVNVRRHAVLVLSHLILNDMVKAKGGLSELAVCTEDPDARVSGAAKLFFQELARKGNAAPIYNHLPDILGRLSTSPEITAESFRSILHFLIAFIEKDKQADSLVDKLTHRLQTTTDVQSWRDVAYCLSQVCMRAALTKFTRISLPSPLLSQG
jgi:condensin complex subunit 1